MTDPLESYVLDANVFIQAKRRFYPFDVSPGYWEALRWHQVAGRLSSVDKVKDELERGADDLWIWARDIFDVSGFHDTAGSVAEYAAMATWVQGNGQYTAAAKAEFMAVADGWLAAFAKTTGKVLVTLEEQKPDAKAKVPLVNICKAFDVRTITPFEMLRRLGIQLSWQPPRHA